METLLKTRKGVLENMFISTNPALSRINSQNKTAKPAFTGAGASRNATNSTVINNYDAVNFIARKNHESTSSVESRVNNIPHYVPALSERERAGRMFAPMLMVPGGGGVALGLNADIKHKKAKQKNLDSLAHMSDLHKAAYSKRDGKEIAIGDKAMANLGKSAMELGTGFITQDPFSIATASGKMITTPLSASKARKAAAREYREDMKRANIMTELNDLVRKGKASTKELAGKFR
jgi:hypothetical protein